VIFADNTSSTVATVSGDPTQATGTLGPAGFVIELDISSATRAYTLPQLAFGGGWYTAAYFTNTTAGQVSLQVNFVGDNGSLLNVPSIGGTSTMVNLAPNGTAIVEIPDNVVNAGLYRRIFADGRGRLRCISAERSRAAGSGSCGAVIECDDDDKHTDMG
jgi:hypothetical protein